VGEINVEKIIQRILRIVKLDQTVYKEIEHDLEANTEAFVIVAAATILAAVGTLLSGAGIGATILGLIIGPLVGWLLWSWVTMFVGTRLFGGQTDFWEMARVLGYANVTRALGIFSFIPCVGAIIGLVAFVLSLVIGFFAVREALDLPTEKAVLTIVISWVVMMVVSFGIAMIFGVGVGMAGSFG
jgi:hypothetical protein